MSCCGTVLRQLGAYCSWAEFEALVSLFACLALCCVGWMCIVAVCCLIIGIGMLAMKLFRYGAIRVGR
eukprot:3899876-Amphidinium_carterae.1